MVQESSLNVILDKGSEEKCSEESGPGVVGNGPVVILRGTTQGNRGGQGLTGKGWCDRVLSGETFTFRLV